MKRNTLLLLLAVLVCCLVLTACDEIPGFGGGTSSGNNDKQLATPFVSIDENGLATWSPIKDAVGYNVRISTAVINIGSLSTDTSTGDITVNIGADDIGAGSNVWVGAAGGSSGESNVWVGAANGSGESDSFNTTECQYQLTKGQAIEVKAVGDGVNHTDSEYSAAQVYFDKWYSSGDVTDDGKNTDDIYGDDGRVTERPDNTSDTVTQGDDNGGKDDPDDNYYETYDPNEDYNQDGKPDGYPEDWPGNRPNGGGDTRQLETPFAYVIDMTGEAKQFSLRWEPVDGADLYEIEEMHSGRIYEVREGTELAIESNEEYRVRAVSRTGEFEPSEWSNPVSVKNPDGDKPDGDNPDTGENKPSDELLPLNVPKIIADSNEKYLRIEWEPVEGAAYYEIFNHYTQETRILKKTSFQTLEEGDYQVRAIPEDETRYCASEWSDCVSYQGKNYDQVVSVNRAEGVLLYDEASGKYTPTIELEMLLNDETARFTGLELRDGDTERTIASYPDFNGVMTIDEGVLCDKSYYVVATYICEGLSASREWTEHIFVSSLHEPWVEIDREGDAIGNDGVVHIDVQTGEHYGLIYAPLSSFTVNFFDISSARYIAEEVLYLIENPTAIEDLRTAIDNLYEQIKLNPENITLHTRIFELEDQLQVLEHAQMIWDMYYADTTVAFWKSIVNTGKYLYTVTYDGQDTDRVWRIGDDYYILLEDLLDQRPYGSIDCELVGFCDLMDGDAPKEVYWDGYVECGDFLNKLDEIVAENAFIDKNGVLTYTLINNSGNDSDYGNPYYNVDRGYLWRVVARDRYGIKEVVLFELSEAPLSAVDEDAWLAEYLECLRRGEATDGLWSKYLSNYERQYFAQLDLSGLTSGTWTIVAQTRLYSGTYEDVEDYTNSIPLCSKETVLFDEYKISAEGEGGGADSAPVEPIMLARPENVRVEFSADGIAYLTWDPVEGAAYYYVMDIMAIAPDACYDVKHLLSYKGSYIVSAVPEDTGRYLQSEWSESAAYYPNNGGEDTTSPVQLSVPQNLRFERTMNGGQMMWDRVEGAASYLVMDIETKMIYDIVETTFILPHFGTFMVQAIPAGGSNALESNWSEPIKCTVDSWDQIPPAPDGDIIPPVDLAPAV